MFYLQGRHLIVHHLNITFIWGGSANQFPQCSQTFLKVSVGAFVKTEPVSISILSFQLPEGLVEVCAQFFKIQNESVTSAYKESY
jgi:hypothetical protein